MFAKEHNIKWIKRDDAVVLTNPAMWSTLLSESAQLGLVALARKTSESHFANSIPVKATRSILMMMTPSK